MDARKEEFVQFLVQNPNNQKIKIFNYCKYTKEFIVDSINWPTVFCKLTEYELRSLNDPHLNTIVDSFKQNNAHLF